MGLFDFIKKAGKAIGIGGADAAESAPPAEAIKKEIEDLGLAAEKVEIEVDGDTVKLRGEAPSQELREKIIIAAGNLSGVARVEEEIASADGAEPAQVFHVVAKGDTLWAISSKYLGKGARYNEIFEANRPMLSHPDKIYPGQTLRIPAK